jgi:hypothetical protein
VGLAQPLLAAGAAVLVLLVDVAHVIERFRGLPRHRLGATELANALSEFFGDLLEGRQISATGERT